MGVISAAQVDLHATARRTLVTKKCGMVPFVHLAVYSKHTVPTQITRSQARSCDTISNFHISSTDITQRAVRAISGDSLSSVHNC